MQEAPVVHRHHFQNHIMFHSFQVYGLTHLVQPSTNREFFWALKQILSVRLGFIERIIALYPPVMDRITSSEMYSCKHLPGAGS